MQPRNIGKMKQVSFEQYTVTENLSYLQITQNSILLQA
jgi:hypothetical protein